MFTINIYLRFALMALFLGGGILLAIFQGFWYAFPLILIGIALLVGYILLGTVQSAAQMVQEMKFGEAKQRLALTIKPDWLYKTNRAFFYMMHGTIAMHEGRNDDAEKWLEKADSIELPSDNEKAMVQLQLANISASKGKWTNAQNHMRIIKKLKVTQPEIKDQLKQMEKAMQNRGQMKHMQGGKNSGAMRPGGKRRRPKMR